MFEIDDWGEAEERSPAERDRDDRLIQAIDEVNAQVCSAQDKLLVLICAVDRRSAWEGTGARDTAHWLGMRYGISYWKAHRWIAAAYALEELPRTRAALCSGELGIDKVAELTRFATPVTEARLIEWGREVSCGAIRHRADLAARADREQARSAHDDRFCTWSFDDEGRRFALQAEMPAAQGVVVARALERMAQQIPKMPDEQDGWSAPARRADALAALCSARIASDPDPDRATVIVHAQLEGLQRSAGGCELEAGPVIDPELVRRLLCNARVQTVVEDGGGTALGVGRMTRELPAWMARQVRYRDGGCRFPGCGARRFTEAHHIRWWRHGGRTDLANLLLICSFHHRLVHELGWSVRRDADGVCRWFHPDGTRYRAGPSPGDGAETGTDEDVDQNHQTALASVG